MRFAELQEYEKIQCIKDTFALVCEVLVNDPKRLDEYFPITPQVKSVELSPKIMAENQSNIETLERVKKAILSLKKKESCSCAGTKCLDIEAILQPLNPDLEPLIEVCRKIAEQRTY